MEKIARTQHSMLQSTAMASLKLHLNKDVKGKTKSRLTKGIAGTSGMGRGKIQSGCNFMSVLPGT